MILVLSSPNNENDKREKADVWKDYTQPQRSGIAVDLEDFPVLSQHITVSQVYREAVSPLFHYGLQNH